MPSILVQYDGEKVKTRKFSGRFRGVTWDRKGTCLTLVGDGGRILRIEGDREIRHDSSTKHNLRAVSINPANGTVLVVGNVGTIITVTSDGSFAKASASTFENLRAVRWNTKGTAALIVGNNGALMKYTERRLDIIDGGRANLRGISWRKESDEALVTSNCFAEEFIPSPNLFAFDAKANALKPLSEGRSDLIGVDWNPNGKLALVVGYDIVWHNGAIGRFDDAGLSPIKFENDHVYPVAVRWDPTGHVAAIVTSTAQLHSGEGRIILWDGEKFKEIYRSNEFFFSHIAWAPEGFKLAAIASTQARAFDS